MKLIVVIKNLKSVPTNPLDVPTNPLDMSVAKDVCLDQK